MRGLVAALAAGVLASCGASTSARDAGLQDAELNLVRLAPPTVRGTGFKPAEGVVVTMTVADRRHTRRTRSNKAGGFVATFSPFVAVDPCSGTIRVVARGSLGSRVTLRRPCRPPDPQP